MGFLNLGNPDAIVENSKPAAWVGVFLLLAPVVTAVRGLIFYAFSENSLDFMFDFPYTISPYLR